MTSDASETYLLVGLGNPGRRYRLTRHNIGFMVIDRFAQRHGGVYSRCRDLHETCDLERDGKRVILLKPLTYMNLSGNAVAPLVDEFRIAHAHLLVILDDFYLPFGKLRLRSKGSDGGHHGLASVIARLGSQSFPRLRIGIGRDDAAGAADYVLSKFSAEERRLLPVLIDTCCHACETFLAEGITDTMNRFNNTLID